MLSSYKRLVPRALKSPLISRIYAHNGLRTAISCRYMSSYTPSPAQTKPYRWVLLLAGTVVAAGVAIKLYINHNYPPEVAALLRKGLRAEIDGAGPKKPDYKLALQYYLEALEKADEVGLHYLSDEYTGLKIKIAEMYEKLDMDEDARHIYRELGTSYIQALADGTQISENLRPHLIQRDLRVALKMAMYESTVNPNIAKMGLLVHFLMAQKEVANKDPEAAKLIESEKNRSEINLAIPIDQDGKSLKNPAAWQPFRDELFSARDMFVALCLATGDIGLALQTKLATTEWMTAAGCDIGDVLMSFYNVGSIFYLQSEELELQKSKADKAEDTEKSEFSEKLASESVNNSSACFNVILDVVEKLPGKARREANVAEVHALSIYGLGVLALHDGDYQKASELLRESRLRAKGCSFDELVNSAELELEKLDKMKNEQKDDENPKKPIKLEPPSMDVLLLKSPESSFPKEEIRKI